jgi:hypothetical protein
MTGKRSSLGLPDEYAQARRSLPASCPPVGAENGTASDERGRPQAFRAPAKNSGLVRVPCGAKRRRDGQPCTALSVPGKKRCKWHGGCSTGPRTAAGKAKSAENLPRLRKQSKTSGEEFLDASARARGVRDFCQALKAGKDGASTSARGEA